MRGADVTQEGLFVARQTPDYVPAERPLRPIRDIINRALRDLDPLFESIYEDWGRPSVPPERLLRGLVLQALYGTRSERLLCEQLGYNLLYRWFVGLNMDEAAWDHSTSTKNRDRLIEHDVGHVLMENRSKLALDTRVTLAAGTGEHEAAIEMLTGLPGEQRRTVGAVKNFDTTDFVSACRDIGVTPHVAQNAYEYNTRTGKRARRRSRIDGRTTRHAGYRASQVIRKAIEMLFGDGKQHGGTIRQVKLRGRRKVSDVFTMAMMAANLRRLPKLLAAAPIMAGSG